MNTPCKFPGRKISSTPFLTIATLLAVGAACGEQAEVVEELTQEATITTNPLLGIKLYVDPNSPARRQVNTWMSTGRVQDAIELDEMADQPMARWFGDWDGDIQVAVNKYVTTVTNAGAVPVLVTYNIPNRDCGDWSAGGAKNAYEYRLWTSRFHAGIANRKVVIILEPDALTTRCVTAERQVLIGESVRTFKQNSRASVYIDAGHPNWIKDSTMAWRLKQANVAAADGFALNVANFYYTSQNITYGLAVSKYIPGGKHFVIDTSRNGAGWNGEWCNPYGRKIGAKPLTAAGSSMVDALLWIKTPGQSDGECNGGPSAGTWWPSYALGLLK